MATSGVTDFSLTARDLISTALEESSVIAPGEEPSDAEFVACIRRFNGLLKSWQAEGVAWKQETIDQTITADTRSATLPSYVRAVNSVRYVESSVNERQMERFERDEYYRLPNKGASGISTIFYVDRNTSDIDIYVWPVPSADATLRLDIDRKMDTITDGSETVDVPEEWAETLYTVLGMRCAGLFLPPEQIKPELANRAAMLERKLFDSYRPASYYMGPDA